MKKYFWFTSVVIFVVSSSFTFDNIQGNIKTTSDLHYSCDSFMLNKEAKTATLLGNVNFETKSLSINNAEKVEWDMKSQKLIAYNVASFDMDGKVVINKSKAEYSSLEYSIGDTVVYLK